MGTRGEHHGKGVLRVNVDGPWRQFFLGRTGGPTRLQLAGSGALNGFSSLAIRTPRDCRLHEFLLNLFFFKFTPGCELVQLEATPVQLLVSGPGGRHAHRLEFSLERRTAVWRAAGGSRPRRNGMLAVVRWREQLEQPCGHR